MGPTPPSGSQGGLGGVGRKDLTPDRRQKLVVALASLGARPRGRRERDLPAAAATQQHPKGPRSPRRRPDARAARPSPPRPLPRGGKKLAATNERPRRRLTSASRRAALPGDPGGSAFSPLPGCAWPRRRAAPGLYIGRALAGLGVPPVRELPSAPAGGGPGRRAALSLLLCPPTPRRGLLPPPPPPPPPRPRKQTFRPSPPLARYSSRFQPGRAAPHRGLLPTLPACSSDHYRTQREKNVDHTPVRLLRYRLLVQDGEIPGQPQSEQHAGQEGGGDARGCCQQLELHAGLPATPLGQQPPRARPPRAQPGQLLAQVPRRPQRQQLRPRRRGRPGLLRPAQGAFGGQRHRSGQQGEQIPGPLVQRERRAQPAPPAPAAAAEGGQRLPDQLHALQDRAVPTLRGERHVQVRREVPVRPRLPRAAQPHSAPQVQDGAVPHLPHHRLLPLRPALPFHPQRGGAAARAIGGRLRGPASVWRARRAAPGLCPGAAAQAASQPQFLGLPVGSPPAPGGSGVAAAARQPHVAHAATALLLGLILFLLRLFLLLHVGRIHALGRPDVLRLGGGCSGGRAALRSRERRRGPAAPRSPVRHLLGHLVCQQRLRLRPGAEQPHHAACHPDPQLRRRGRRLLPQPAAGPGRPRAAPRATRRGPRAALAALRLPAAAPSVRVARVRRAPQPPGLAVGPRQLPERLAELGQPQRLRVPQPGSRPPPAHLQPPLHLRRLRQGGAREGLGRGAAGGHRVKG